MTEFKTAKYNCFTLNNYTEDDVQTIKTKWKCKYCVIGYEIAPNTGTPHLQGYVEWTYDKSFNTLKRLHPHIHWEKRRGSAAEASNYCKKGNSFWESGELSNSRQGERVDLDELKSEILDGRSVEDIALENPILYHQYGRTLNKLEDIALRKKFRTWTTECHWFFGGTACGKSKEAFENYNPDTHYVWKRDNGWQDGYTGQETVIIDDFRGEIPYGELLNLCDCYPYTLRRRNREPVPFLAKKIIITAPKNPYETYCNLSAKDSIEQLIRRCTIFHFDENKIKSKWSKGNTKLSTVATLVAPITDHEEGYEI